MAEHQIQLRRAWEGTFLEGESRVGRRVDLPTRWPPELRAPFELSRAFQRPPLGPGEILALRLDSVAGLVSVRLNDHELARPTPGTADLELAIGEPSRPRNLLVLEIDPAGFAGPEVLWGTVALVIRSE